jgi:hypothetical protein
VTVGGRGAIVILCGALAACRAASTEPPHDAEVHADPAEAIALSETTVADRPRYDLVADLRERISAAHKRFGAAARVTLTGDTFVLVAADPGAPLERADSLAREALAAYFHGRFERRPDRVVTVLLFGGASDYGAYCRNEIGAACEEDLGTYSVLRSEILVDAGPGLGTLTHELVHPLVQYDFPRAPQWFNEGLASLFEAPVFPAPGEVHGQPNWRMPILARALRTADAASRPHLDALFGTSDGAFRSGETSLHYATARAFCEWLDERSELWTFYHAWRDSAERDPDGRLAFQSVEHRTPAEADVEWARWVLETARVPAR